MDKKEDKQKWERINPKLNIKNFLPRLKQSINTFIKYGHAYFFDSNMIIMSKANIDKRVNKLFTINRNYFLTNVMDRELPNMSDNTTRKKVFTKKYKAISLNDMRIKYPEACVHYHSFIRKMNNPGNIFDPNFFVEQYLAFLNNQATISEGGRRRYEQIKTRRANGLKKKENIFGEKTSRIETIIDEAFHNLRRKKEKATKKEGLNTLNDIKNLSLALTFCLIYKKNTTLVTADKDLVAYTITLIESVAQYNAMLYYILQQMTMGDKIALTHDKDFTLKLDLLKLKKLTNELRADTIARDYKKDTFKFNIKVWDIKTKKYYTPVSISFDKPTRQNFLGHVCSCPCVKNNELGNFIGFQWYWPPNNLEDIIKGVIKIDVTKKLHINYHEKLMSNEEHAKICHYTSLADNDKHWSGFTVNPSSEL